MSAHPPGAWRTRTAQRGQSLIEYVVILVLVAIVVVVVLALMGKQIQNAFQDVVDLLEGP